MKMLCVYLLCSSYTGIRVEVYIYIHIIFENLFIFSYVTIYTTPRVHTQSIERITFYLSSSPIYHRNSMPLGHHINIGNRIDYCKVIFNLIFLVIYKWVTVTHRA